MKKIVVTFIALVIVVAGFAQKFAFVDTEYILSNIPTFESAQEQLDQQSIQWQKEIEGVYSEIDKMYKEFQAEKVLLSEEMKIKRENDIINKEKEVKTLQKKYFGKEGELYKKRQELIKPIQDEIFNAVKEMAEEGNYAVIFDSASGSANMLFTDPKYDKSDDILEKMGYKN